MTQTMHLTPRTQRRTDDMEEPTQIPQMSQMQPQRFIHASAAGWLATAEGRNREWDAGCLQAGGRLVGALANSPRLTRAAPA